MFERLDLDDAIRDIEKMKKEIARLKSQVKKGKKELLKASEIHGAVDVQCYAIYCAYAKSSSKTTR